MLWLTLMPESRLAAKPRKGLHSLIRDTWLAAGWLLVAQCLLFSSFIQPLWAANLTAACT